MWSYFRSVCLRALPTSYTKIENEEKIFLALFYDSEPLNLMSNVEKKKLDCA